MKRISTLSVFAVLASLLFGSCVKNGIFNNEESYWLSCEQGQVVYTSSTCNYYVVETNNGYSILRSNTGYKPYERDIVYGDFGYRGTRDIYNWSSRYVFSATITDYRLSYTQAQLALDYYCPYGKGERTFLKADALKK